MAVSGSTSSRSGFVPDHTGLLAHPAWIDYPRLEAAARRWSKKGRYADRQQVMAALFKAWRLPDDAPLLIQILEYELRQPDFFAELVRHAVPEAVIECLRLLHAMGQAACSEAQFLEYQAQLMGWRKVLASGLSSQQLLLSQPWRAEQQLPQLLTVLKAWQAHPLLGEYYWQWQARLEQQAKRAQEQEQQRLAREQQKEQARLAQQEREQAARQRLDTLLASYSLSPEHFPQEAFETLQAGEGARDFMAVHGRGASAAVLRETFELEDAVYAQLKLWQAEREAQVKAQRAQRWQWEQACIGAEATMAQLGITRGEYDVWLSDKRLPAVRLTRSKGKGAKAEWAHHPDLLATITQEQIALWRDKDLASMNARQRTVYQRSIDRARTQWSQAQVLAQIQQQFECTHEPDPDDDSRLLWTKDIFLPVLLHGSETAQWRANVQMSIALPVPRTQSEQERLPARIAQAFGAAAQQRLSDLLRDTVMGFLATQKPLLAAQAYQDLKTALKQVLEDGITQADIQAGKLESYLRQGPVRRILDMVEQQRAQDLLRLGDFPQMFTLARAIRRHIVLRLGPTNSGKTHEALEALMEARSGVYLAPLRLLAMEVRDRLMQAGIPCNLITGEERVMVPGAQHTACTVEMMDPTLEVRVAVLDEIQMLADEQRGWAWTAALVGMPARTLFVCGDESVLDPCLRVVSAMEERYELEYTQRKTPLEVMAQPLASPRTGPRGAVAPQGRRQRQKEVAGVSQGDAIIAFSRKDVLTLSARFRAQGLSVASIYGALAPEVRRTESERFASGAADVLVSTDAIGMGLNLPIRRVIFSTSWKFDGRAMRQLNPTEVRQIAGRAGRFGLYHKGYVGAMDTADLNHIRSMLDQPLTKWEQRLPIAPSQAHIQALSELLNTEHIGVLLQYFANKVASDSPLFQTAGLKDTVELGFWVDRLAGNLSLAEKFSFACAPVSVDKDEELDYYKRCLKAYVARQAMDMPAVPSWLKASSPARLEDAERLSKQISLYAWLSMKFSQVFYQWQELVELRAYVSRFIERSLLHQSGFGKTSKEAFEGFQGGRRP